VNSLKTHNKTVRDVQRQVARFFERKQQARIFHGGTNSTRTPDIDRSKVIDISRLDRIIEINNKQKYVLVEPNVSLERLIDATLKHGLMPPVISEFPAITVGGAIQGGAGESSSFKYGCLHEPSLEYEIVLGDGSRLVATPSQNIDLFRGIACSCGTIGILTMVKMRLVPCTAYVKLAYQRVRSASDAVSLINLAAKSPGGPDFIDGIMFSKNHGVIMLGYYTEESNLPRASFNKFSDEWFYIHAEKVTKNNEVYEELVPIKDYLFRYDRGAFWMGREGLGVIHLPFNRFTRLLLAPLYKTSTIYRFLHNARLGQQFLVQDICLPQTSVVDFINYVDKKHGIYPLWLCPLKPSKTDKLSPTYLNTDLVINVGVWGAMQEDYKSFVLHNRQLEDQVNKLGGRKVLYAHSYYPEPDFWKIYDKKDYLGLRKKYAANTVFPDIYKKTHVSVKYEPSIARGWWKLITNS
jgi:delta24-sterol reductase